MNTTTALHDVAHVQDPVRRLRTGARVYAWACGAALLVLLPARAHAQGTAADYRRAEELRDRLDGLVVGVAGPPNWIGTSNRFWYRRTVTGGHEYMLVDAETLEKRPAFDHERLARALSAATDTGYTALSLPFGQAGFEFVDDEAAITFELRDAPWRCTLAAEYACARDTARPRQEERSRPQQWSGRRAGAPEDDARQDPVRSPDGKLEAYIRNHNVWVRTVGADPDDGRPLSMDGSEGDAYRHWSIVWSPDSKKLAAYRVRPGYRRMIHFIESSPRDQIQPKYSNRFYLKPGDALDVSRPVLFHVDTGEQFVVDDALFPNAYSMSRLVWREDGRAFTFEYNERGHQVFRVIEVDAATGKPRALIDERMPTFIDYSSKRYRFDIADGREIIWRSERDGWSHLYLYDGITGRVKNQITRGRWVVRGVDTVDVEKRQIWFRASGVYPDQDPYFIHYYRIDFDGKNLTAFTEADGTHTVSFSPDREYYVDTWSRVDLPPVTQLRRTRDRAVLLELERGDMSALLATGWRPPEPFVAKGRDGETDIWGIIIRPTNFDPSKRYPVIEYIYAGPHSSHVPKAFGLNFGLQRQAELGFIVVQIDGMGTSNRSKAFHDVAWRNLGDAGFPDRIRWHRAVAAKYPWYDIDRVGIYGASAGGQNALGALLFHPDFYDAAVSAVGCHDNRMDKIWWTEQWMGWPVGPHYAASSNVDNAHRLQGKLLLVVGELDTNVDPASTLQVADALIRADKYFDLLFIPGAGHGSGGEYGERKRWDFFVQHLLGVTPPDRNRVLAAASSKDGVEPRPQDDDGLLHPGVDEGYDPGFIPGFVPDDDGGFAPGWVPDERAAALRAVLRDSARR